jgi:predicted phosphate transport protein (TIGR00153 family)
MKPPEAWYGARTVGLQDFFRSLLPKEEKLFDLLEQQAGIAHQAAQALASFKDGLTVGEVGKLVQEQEHAGDKIVHEIEETLAKTYVTPIDREDIHSLSVELDDVTDLINQAARACELTGVERPNEAMTEMMVVLVKCTGELTQALPMLRKRDYPGIFAAKARVRSLEKEGDRVHRSAISELFRTAEIDAKVLLREREILEDLENALDHCERVADSLATLAVKHG